MYIGVSASFVILVITFPSSHQVKAGIFSKPKPPVAAVPPADCYPPPRNGVPQYIIAYGSLMNKASKERTDANSGPNIPIRVKGFTRKWNCKGTPVGFSTTFLGVDVDAKNTKGFVASVYRIGNSQGMQAYDQREEFYCRKKVDKAHIQFLSSKTNFRGKRGGHNIPENNADIWIYVTRPSFRQPSDTNFPKVESYVDVFISGCLELQENFGLKDFAKECVLSTQGWEQGPWVNDRIYPRRPFMFQPKAGAIDKLLMTHAPKAFQKIRIQ